eukprot:1016626-Pleurochrysis_carterae.AAC.2
MPASSSGATWRGVALIFCYMRLQYATVSREFARQSAFLFAFLTNMSSPQVPCSLQCLLPLVRQRVAPVWLWMNIVLCCVAARVMRRLSIASTTDALRQRKGAMSECHILELFLPYLPLLRHHTWPSYCCGSTSTISSCRRRRQRQMCQDEDAAWGG